MKKAIGPKMKMQMKKDSSQQKMTSFGLMMKTMMNGIRLKLPKEPIREEKEKEGARKARENSNPKGEEVSDHTGEVERHI